MSTPRVALSLATGLGVGYAPFAPGTFGSLLGLVCWALLPKSPAAQLASIAAVSVIGIWSADIAERHLHREDPGPVVIDEVVGILITLAFIPASWISAAAGFFLFRFFDIIKPYPANRLEKLGGGLGIMADDAMAAVYSHLALRGALMLAAAIDPSFSSAS